MSTGVVELDVAGAEHATLTEQLLFLLQESVAGRIAIIYHRSKVEGIEELIRTGGFRPSDRGLYGGGVYSTWDLSSQLNSRMTRLYGSYVFSAKADLSNHLILDSEVFGKVFKKKTHKGNALPEDVEKIYKGRLVDSWIGAVKRWMSLQGNSFSSDLAKSLSTESHVRTNFSGIVFKGRLDGNVVLTWDMSKLTPLKMANIPAEDMRSGRPKDYEWVSVLNKSILKRSLLTSVGIKDPLRRQVTSALKTKGSKMTKDAFLYLQEKNPTWLVSIASGHLDYSGGTIDYLFPKEHKQYGLFLDPIVLIGGMIRDTTLSKKAFVNCTLTNCTLVECYAFDCVSVGSKLNTSTWNGGKFTGKTQNSQWLDGVFQDGVFFGSRWKGGVFEGGAFEHSMWLGGVWKGGVWDSSRWEKGTWKQGVDAKTGRKHTTPPTVWSEQSQPQTGNARLKDPIPA